MRRPDGLWSQYFGKAVAEAARGNGFWPLQEYPCNMEPPWEPFDRNKVTPWDCYINYWEGPAVDGLLGRLLHTTPVLRRGAMLRLPPATDDSFNRYCDELALLLVEQFSEDESTIPKAQQLLLSLSALAHPVAFEVLGLGPQPRWDHGIAAAILEARARGEKRRMDEAIAGWTEPYTTVQFAAHHDDISLLRRQLTVHYPNSAIVEQSIDYHPCQPGHCLRSEEQSSGAMMLLEAGHCVPLRTFGRLDPDPLAVAIAAMEDLGEISGLYFRCSSNRRRQPWAEQCGRRSPIPTSLASTSSNAVT